MHHFHWLKYLNQRQIDGKCYVFKEEMKNIEIVCLHDKRISTNDKILRTHSELARDILEKSVEIPSEIQVDRCIEADQLEIINSYMNNGVLQNEDITCKLLKSANYLKMRFLERKCANYLMNNICVANVFEILCCAYWTRERKLATATWEFLVKNTEKIMSPEGWNSEDFQYFQRAWKHLYYASTGDYGAVCELQMLFSKDIENSDNDNV